MVHFLFVCFLFWGVGVSWVYLFVIFGLILWLVYFMVLFFFVVCWNWVSGTGVCCGRA